MNKMNVNINMSDTKAVECNECECTEFVQVYQIRRISPVVSPTGQETFVPVQLFRCASCGHVNEEFFDK